MALMETFNLVIDYSSLLFTAVGTLSVIFGGIAIIAKLLEKEILSKRGVSHEKIHESIRRDFSRRIIFGLEFLIAADILKTVQSPDTAVLTKLAVTVLIRVSLGYILSKDAGK